MTMSATGSSAGADIQNPALTLRLASAPDAAAFRRGIAAGAIAVTLLFGAIAAAAAELRPQTDIPGPNGPLAAPIAAPHGPSIHWGHQMIPQ